MAQNVFFIIEASFHKRMPNVNLVGPTTITVTEDGFCKKGCKLYLRGHEDMMEPRLNQDVSVAERFTSKEEAEEIASNLSKTTFKEGRIVCKVKKNSRKLKKNTEKFCFLEKSP